MIDKNQHKGFWIFAAGVAMFSIGLYSIYPPLSICFCGLGFIFLGFLAATED